MKIRLFKINELRVRKRFLFFPKQGENLMRWLETAKWIEEYNGTNWKFIKWLDLP